MDLNAANWYMEMSRRSKPAPVSPVGLPRPKQMQLLMWRCSVEIRVSNVCFSSAHVLDCFHALSLFW